MDFQYLKNSSEAVVARFETLIKNVKARSNSFYDSYLDLQEAFTKEVLKTSGFPLTEEKNSGYLLHGTEVKEFLARQFGVPEDLVEKLHDHTLKANRHKHSKEKTITLDSVNAFMEPFYVFSRLCFALTSVGQFAYDPNYFASIFGALEKENKELRQQVDGLLHDAEAMAAAHKITEEQLIACRGAVAALNGDYEDLQKENEQIKSAVGFLQTVTTQRIEKLEQHVQKVDEMIALFLNELATEGPVLPKQAVPAKPKHPIPIDTTMVDEFFKHAKLYFMDEENGRVYKSIVRMVRRGFFLAVAGLISFLGAMYMPSGLAAFCVIGLLEVAYGVAAIVIGMKMPIYMMHDPLEYWTMARGSAVYDGKSVLSEFHAPKWRPITTILSWANVVGLVAMLIALFVLAGTYATAGSIPTAIAFSYLQGHIVIIFLVRCMLVTERKYEYRYIVFQYGDDVIRLDRKTGIWSTRDKKLKGVRE